MAHDIRHLVALRGDMPSGMREAGEFRYANELVEFIRAETGDHFFIEVAAYPEFHPQARSAEVDLLNFKRKVEAGADAALTQYFYNADAYFAFVDSCERLGLDLPIVPGEEVVTELCRRLLEGGAPGLHFYTMNRAEASLAIWSNLGLETSRSKRS